MAGTHRTSPTAVAFLEALAADPTRADFFHALRSIERLHTDLPRLGRALRPADEPVRLAQPASMIFAPSTIARVDLQTAQGTPRIEVMFLGLLGPHGALPTHLTELVYERARHHDDRTLARFLDVFHHRMLLLFYRAWAEARSVVGRDRPADDGFGRHLAALAGRAGREFERRDAMPDDAKQHFVGHLASIARRPGPLRAMLENLLRVPVGIRDFVPRWLTLPLDGRWRLGKRRGFSVLGHDAIAGERVPDVQSGVRIVLGPLTLSRYEAFLPRGEQASAVRDIVANVLGHEYAWDLQLALRANEVPRLRLGEGAQLGWTTWLGERPTAAPADDLILNPGLQ